MEKEKLFEASLNMISELQNEIINSDVMDCGPRLELVEQCIYISFQHGIGVNSLLTAGLPIQAMVLLRAQFEAVVKSYWLLLIATNDQVSSLNFSWTNEEQNQKDKYPMVSEMLKKLSNLNHEAHNVILQLVEFKDYNLKPLNSFVHTGKHSFTRNVVGFEKAFLLKLMTMSNNLISTAAQVMLKHTIPDKQKFLGRLTKKYRHCFYLIDDLKP